MALGTIQQENVCEICSIVGHPTDACPTLQEGAAKQVNDIGDFQCNRDIDMIHILIHTILD